MSYYEITLSEEETTALGRRLGSCLQGGSVVLIDGDLGAGKTRLAQGIAEALGVNCPVTSPTFNLVLEYPLTRGLPSLLRHFDLYRLEDPDQLEDLDYFGLLEQQDAVSVVEWGSKFAAHLPRDFIQVTLTVDQDHPHERRVELSCEGESSLVQLSRFVTAETRMYLSD
ncbi:MAG: tRNA (adenosine(37)-N6)-threonylcarbamoyltransferase complex ATPase subunit type 1 TsaE [Coriobacteriia bacterium]|nr:tRNA (adenosine(37)-N6)-threonylcarbamoyltransferase complex ATPase subunit type 1 TsaE [Coriobacteriia bacterium]